MQRTRTSMAVSNCMISHKRQAVADWLAPSGCPTPISSTMNAVKAATQANSDWSVTRTPTMTKMSTLICSDTTHTTMIRPCWPISCMKRSSSTTVNQPSLWSLPRRCVNSTTLSLRSNSRNQCLRHLRVPLIQ